MLYYLYQVSKDSKHSQLTRWEMVDLLKKSPDHSDWMYWTPSETQWKPVTESKEIQEWIAQSESFPTAPPPLPKAFPKPTKDPAAERLYGLLIETPSIKDEQQFEVIMEEAKPLPVSAVSSGAVPVKDSSKDSRKHARVHGKLRTIITNKSKAFITYSKDISLGGIQLEQSIPAEIIKGELEIYVSDPRGKKSLLLNCRVVGDQHDSKRFSFYQLETDQSKKLSAWIQELQYKKVS